MNYKKITYNLIYKDLDKNNQIDVLKLENIQIILRKKYKLNINKIYKLIFDCLSDMGEKFHNYK